jgi:hypothetical protein
VIVTVPTDPFSPVVKIPDGVSLIPAKDGDPLRNAQLLQALLTVLMDGGWKDVQPGHDTISHWKEFKILVGFEPPAYELVK